MECNVRKKPFYCGFPLYVGWVGGLIAKSWGFGHLWILLYIFTVHSSCKVIHISVKVIHKLFTSIKRRFFVDKIKVIHIIHRAYYYVLCLLKSYSHSGSLSTYPKYLTNSKNPEPLIIISIHAIFPPTYLYWLMYSEM